jgi:TatD DNase family protein
MQFIDTHAHLYADEFSKDIDGVIEHALDNKVMQMILPDIDSGSREAMLKLYEKYPGNCPVMIGLHPTSVKENYREELQKIDKLIDSYDFCGIGECGIDCYWDKTYLEQQSDAFYYQIELALKYSLPIVIHSRLSLHLIFGMLQNYKYSGLTGVFHCFPGNIADAQKAIDMGFYLGIGGVVTYKNSGMAAVVKHFRLENILLETDAPYLTPIPHRGKRNQSAYIPIIAEFVAALKGVSIEEVAEITTANAIRLFNLS